MENNIKTVSLPSIKPTTWQNYGSILKATLDRREALILRGIELSKQEAL